MPRQWSGVPRNSSSLQRSSPRRPLLLTSDIPLIAPIRTGTERPRLFHVRKMLADRRGSTSIEYAQVVSALALVLFEVLQAPALFAVIHSPAKSLGLLIMNLFAGLFIHVSAS